MSVTTRRLPHWGCSVAHCRPAGLLSGKWYSSKTSPSDLTIPHGALVTPEDLEYDKKYGNKLSQRRKRASRRFVDRRFIYAQGGTGGFASLNPPSAGGHGGNVILIAAENCSLAEVPPSAKADHGSNGHPKKLKGTNGKNRYVNVPLGTVVRTPMLRTLAKSIFDTDNEAGQGQSGNEYIKGGRILADLDKEGDHFVLAEGGSGGLPMPGQMHAKKPKGKHFQLELKAIADVGLIGFPNAGKSSLLNSLTRARAHVANYPFTTLRPQVAHIDFDPDLCDYLGLPRQYNFGLKANKHGGVSITLADIPGLIEGASENRGRGHTFLKHVERTKMNLLVVDPFGFQLKEDSPRRTGPEILRLLLQELKACGSVVIKRPSILVVSRGDRADVLPFYRDIKNTLNELTEDYPDMNLTTDDCLLLDCRKPEQTGELKARLLAKIWDGMKAVVLNSLPNRQSSAMPRGNNLEDSGPTIIGPNGRPLELIE
eukprot:Clim_evm55s207 gene=Clim_evmTU55s207